MTHATEPDLGPLTWVKGEIDAALGRAREILERGCAAFAELGDVAGFLADIRRSETTAMQRLFAGERDPFGAGTR